jgi:dsRNA-specific ribonuclease
MVAATNEMRRAGFAEEEVLAKAFEAVVGAQLSIPVGKE